MTAASGPAGRDRLDLTEVHRFVNRPVRLPEGLGGNVLALCTGIPSGSRVLGPVDSIGVDSRPVDCGVLDAVVREAAAAGSCGRCSRPPAACRSA
ncbi:hypothetical protein [Streptomyces sp. NPDC019224]|uniref:hypothetical protein n=1 Tax=Streptomyces sp. NPDC019224 TaxID=3154484 RepID=UPI0033C13807